MTEILKTKEQLIFEERLSFYLTVTGILAENEIPHGVIGGFGQDFYGSGRKASGDMDVALEPKYVGRALSALEQMGLSTEYKHPNWLNQVWSRPSKIDGSQHSLDLIHRHSTGLAEVEPWWIEKGIYGQIYGLNLHFAAPEAIALTKVLLLSRRPYDMPDAVQTVQECARVARPFDWHLLLDNLHSDWRLGFALAVTTEILYGQQSTAHLTPDVKERMHNSLTVNPSPGQVRGHIFAYDLFEGAGDLHSWQHPNRSSPSENSVEQISEELYRWNIDPLAMPRAARMLVSEGKSFDWDSLTSALSDNWRLALCLAIYIEVLFGKSGSEAIPENVKHALSEQFLQSQPNGEGLGKQLFPHRF